MTVSPPEWSPVWLATDDVLQWLQANQQPSSDIVGLVRICTATEVHVQRSRPELWTETVEDGTGETVRVYVPDAEAYQGAVMYAARECRRRNNPSGTETFGDGGLTFVSRYDPDIDRALHTGSYQMPATG